MAVEKIEEYKQKDGLEVLKVLLVPTYKFPEGSYFYCDAEDIDLVKSYGWGFITKGKTAYISCHIKGKHAYFHGLLAVKKLGHPVDFIDHRNLVGFDNCDKNLFNVSMMENQQNQPIKGYSLISKTDYRRNTIERDIWLSHIKLNGRQRNFRQKNELEACVSRFNLEREFYTNPYDFKLDRSQSIDLLDLERTGQISAEEATYRHVLKYADNAWYYYRYGLEEYFRDNHIPVPSYALDELGYMIHPVTGQKLCPIKK